MKGNAKMNFKHFTNNKYKIVKKLHDTGYGNFSILSSFIKIQIRYENLRKCITNLKKRDY